jgi:hypothetical protein
MTLLSGSLRFEPARTAFGPDSGLATTKVTAFVSHSWANGPILPQKAGFYAVDQYVAARNRFGGSRDSGPAAGPILNVRKRIRESHR